MYRNIIGGGLCAAVAIFYFFANMFVSDEIAASFVYNGKQYDLYLDHHPDGSVYASLWNEEGDTVYAATDWFRGTKALSVDCTALNACYVIRSVNAATGEQSGWKLEDKAIWTKLTDAQYLSDETIGFEKFTRSAPPVVVKVPEFDASPTIALRD